MMEKEEFPLGYKRSVRKWLQRRRDSHTLEAKCLDLQLSCNQETPRDKMSLPSVTEPYLVKVSLVTPGLW